MLSENVIQGWSLVEAPVYERDVADVMTRCELGRRIRTPEMLIADILKVV